MRIEEVFRENLMQKTVIITTEDGRMIMGDLLGVIRDELLLESNGSEQRIRSEEICSLTEATEENSLLLNCNAFEKVLIEGRLELFGDYVEHPEKLEALGYKSEERDRICNKIKSGTYGKGMDAYSIAARIDGMQGNRGQLAEKYYRRAIVENNELNRGKALTKLYLYFMAENRCEDAVALVQEYPELENFSSVTAQFAYIRALQACGQDVRDYYRHNYSKVSPVSEADYLLILSHLRQMPDNLVAGQFFKKLLDSRENYLRAAAEALQYSLENQKPEDFLRLKTRFLGKYIYACPLEQLREILSVDNPIGELPEEGDKQQLLEEAVTRCLEKPFGIFNAVLLEQQAEMYSAVLEKEKQNQREGAEEKLARYSKQEDKSLFLLQLRILACCGVEEERITEYQGILRKNADNRLMDALIQYQYSEMGLLLKDTERLLSMGYTEAEVEKFRKTYAARCYPEGNTDYEAASRLQIWGFNDKALELYKKSLNSLKHKEALNQIMTMLIGMKDYEDYEDYYMQLDNVSREKTLFKNFYLETLFRMGNYEKLLELYRKEGSTITQAAVLKNVLVAELSVPDEAIRSEVRCKILELPMLDVVFWQSYLTRLRSGNEEDFLQLRRKIMEEKGYAGATPEKTAELLYSIDGIWQRRGDIEFLRGLPEQGESPLLPYILLRTCENSEQEQKEYFEEILRRLEEDLNRMAFEEAHSVAGYLLKNNYDNEQLRRIYEISGKGRDIYNMLPAGQSNYAVSKRFLLLGFDREKAYGLLQEELESGMDEEQSALCGLELVNHLVEDRRYEEAVNWGSRILTQNRIFSYPAVSAAVNKAYDELQDAEGKKQLTEKLEQFFQTAVAERNFTLASQIRDNILMLDKNNRLADEYGEFFKMVQNGVLNVNEEDIIGQANIIRFVERDNQKYIGFLKGAIADNRLRDERKTEGAAMLLEALEEIQDWEQFRSFAGQLETLKISYNSRLIDVLRRFSAGHMEMEERIRLFAALVDNCESDQKTPLLQKLEEFYEEALEKQLDIDTQAALGYMWQLLQLMPSFQVKLCYVRLLLSAGNYELAQKLLVLFVPEKMETEDKYRDAVNSLAQQHYYGQLPGLDQVFADMVKSDAPYSIRQFSDQYKSFVTFTQEEKRIQSAMSDKAFRVNVGDDVSRHAVIKAILCHPTWYKAWYTYFLCITKGSTAAEPQLRFGIYSNLYVTNKSAANDDSYNNSMRSIPECEQKYRDYAPYYFLYMRYLRGDYLGEDYRIDFEVKKTTKKVSENKKLFQTEKGVQEDTAYKARLARDYIDLFKLLDYKNDYLFVKAARYVANNSHQEEYFYHLFRTELLQRELVTCIRQCIELVMRSKGRENPLLTEMLQDLEKVKGEHYRVIDFLWECARDKENVGDNEVILKLLYRYREEPEDAKLDELTQEWQRTGEIDRGIRILQRLRECFQEAPGISHALSKLYTWSHDEKYFWNLYQEQIKVLKVLDSEKALFKGCRKALILIALMGKDNLYADILQQYEEYSHGMGEGRTEELNAYKEACQVACGIYGRNDDDFVADLLKATLWNSWVDFPQKHIKSQLYQVPEILTLLQPGKCGFLAANIRYAISCREEEDDEAKQQEVIGIVDNIVQLLSGQSPRELIERVLTLPDAERKQYGIWLGMLKKGNRLLTNLFRSREYLSLLYEGWDFVYGKEEVLEQLEEYDQVQQPNYLDICVTADRRYQDEKLIYSQAKLLFQKKQYELLDALCKEITIQENWSGVKTYRGAARIMGKLAGADLYVKQLEGAEFLDVAQLICRETPGNLPQLKGLCNTVQLNALETVIHIVAGNYTVAIPRINEERSAVWKEPFLQLLYIYGDMTLKKRLEQEHGEAVAEGNYITPPEEQKEKKMFFAVEDREILPQKRGIMEYPFMREALESIPTEEYEKAETEGFQKLQKEYDNLHNADESYQNLELRKELLAKLIYLAKKGNRADEYVDYCTHLGIVIFRIQRETELQNSRATLFGTIGLLDQKSRQTVAAAREAFQMMMADYQSLGEIIDDNDELEQSIKRLLNVNTYRPYSEFLANMGAIREKLVSLSEQKELEQRRQQLNEIEKQLGTCLNKYDTFRDVYRAWREICHEETQRLEKGVVLSLKMETLQCGLSGKICGVIHNAGKKPAENVVVRALFGDNIYCRENEKRFKVIYGEDTVTVAFDVRCREEGKRHPYTVELEYDNEKNAEKAEYHFEVRIEDRQVENLSSPYFFSPVKQDNDFYGRTEELDKILRYLNSTANDPIVMRGLKRVGKTSILLRLERMLCDSEEYIPIYQSCQGYGTNMINSVFVGSVITRLKAEGVEDEECCSYAQYNCSENPEKLYDFYQYLQNSGILGKKRILLMIDEVEEIFENVDDGHDDGEKKDEIASKEGTKQQPYINKRIYKVLRTILQHLGCVRFIFCGADYLTDILYNNSLVDLFETTQPVIIRRLDRKAARQVVTEPVAGIINYTEEALERIWYYLGGHSFYIKKTCAEIVSILNDEIEIDEDEEETIGRGRVTVYANDVDIAVNNVLSVSSNMSYLDRFLSRDEEQVIKWLCDEMHSAVDLVPMEHLEEKAESVWAEGKGARLKRALEKLLFKDIILKKKDFETDYYKFSIEIFRMWYSIGSFEDYEEEK